MHLFITTLQHIIKLPLKVPSHCSLIAVRLILRIGIGGISTAVVYERYGRGLRLSNVNTNYSSGA